MTSEAPTGECGQYRDDLLRLAWGDLEASGVSAALDGHLASCAGCQQRLAEWRELAGSMVAALRPDPIPNRLTYRLQQELNSRKLPLVRLSAWPLSVVGAAAAALLVALLIPVQTVSRPGSFVQSDEDAAAIAAAIGLLEWGDPLDYSIDRMSATLDSIEQTVKWQAGEESLLPWAAEDNWDALPAPTPTPSTPPGRNSEGAQRPRNLVINTLAFGASWADPPLRSG
jgi:hypothetical protein